MKRIDLKQKVSILSINILMITSVFITQLIALVLAGILIIIFLRIGVIPMGVEESMSDAGRVIVFMFLGSMVIGTSITVFVSRYQMKSVEKLIHKMRLLAAGNYKTRIKYKKPFNKLPPVKAITDSFNILAEELEHTEMLRSNFVNNFSHEFKTPISSIAGFANLVRNGDLTDEERNEYLEIIESESGRLSQFTTNILNMTRVENQIILSEKTTFSLSEQIRFCFILLEDKWSRKNQDFQLEFGEHTITANEELLKHVWVNLLENAIKFAPYDGRVAVTISETGDEIAVCVSNTGSEIPKDKQARIFSKFYQVDESHSSAGNGIGLSIVKKVVELHDGKINVGSGDGKTEFTVILPK